jgi:hypothetical protein
MPPESLSSGDGRRVAGPWGEARSAAAGLQGSTVLWLNWMSGFSCFLSVGSCRICVFLFLSHRSLTMSPKLVSNS